MAKVIQAVWLILMMILTSSASAMSMKTLSMNTPFTNTTFSTDEISHEQMQMTSENGSVEMCDNIDCSAGHCPLCASAIPSLPIDIQYAKFPHVETPFVRIWLSFTPNIEHRPPKLNSLFI